MHGDFIQCHEWVRGAVCPEVVKKAKENEKISKEERLKRALNHKFLSPEKREALGLPSDNLTKLGLSGGRDYVRELVRIRDKRTCQNCKRVWNQGERRFDVHHLDEEYEGKSAERGSIRWDRENLDRMVTLCHKCHLNLDSVRKKMSVAQREHLDKKGENTLSPIGT